MKHNRQVLRFGLVVSFAFVASLSARAQFIQGHRTANSHTTVAAPQPVVTAFVPATVISQPSQCDAKFLGTSSPPLRRISHPHVINCSPAAVAYPVIYPSYYYADDFYSDSPGGFVDTDESLHGPAHVPHGPSRYYDLGRDWGQDLRRNVVTWEQFVAFVKEEIINAAPEVFADFRGAFIESYGTNAEAALDKALDAARSLQQATGPKIITMPSKTGY